MSYAIVENGVVTNVIDADEEFAASIGAIPGNGAIGDLYDGHIFTKPTPVVVVPQVVTMRQARIALINHNLVETVEAAIDAIPDAIQKNIARATWDHSIEVQRHQPFVLMISEAIGLNSSALDALFIEAAKL